MSDRDDARALWLDLLVTRFLDRAKVRDVFGSVEACRWVLDDVRADADEVRGRRMSVDGPRACQMTDLPSASDWATTAHAASRLGVGEHRVRVLLGSGELRGRKTGRTWEVEMASLNEMLERRSA